jgi:hypothetical protein
VVEAIAFVIAASLLKLDTLYPIELFSPAIHSIVFGLRHLAATIRASEQF